VMEKLGLGFDTLTRWNPRISLLSISSQGADGPERDYVSFGGTLEALGGMMAVTGYGPTEPTWTTSKVNYPDQAVALLAPGTCSLRMRTPLGSTVRRTRESPDAVNASAGVSRGSCGAPFIRSSLGHRLWAFGVRDDTNSYPGIAFVPKNVPLK